METICTFATRLAWWRRSVDFSSCSRTLMDGISSSNIPLAKSLSQVSTGFFGGGQCFVLVFIEYFLGIVLVSFVRFYKGRPGGRNASVQKPFWERRSVHQVWRAVSWERLDQHRETNGEFPAVLMLLTKTFFFLNHLLK